MKKLAVALTVYAMIARCGLADSLGTGFAVSRDIVLTAYSIVGNARTIDVKFLDTEWMTATYLEGNQKEGWCLLRLSENAPGVVCIETARSFNSETDAYVLYAERDEGSVDVSHEDGCITSLNDRGEIIASVDSNCRCAGAPLFIDESDKVVGLILSDGKRRGSSRLNAISLQAIKSVGRQASFGTANPKRKSNKRAVCAIRSTGSINDLSVRDSGNDTNTSTYQKSKSSVVTIEGESGVGTGFVCLMEGKKYLVTNKHVADQRGKIKAYFLDGELLSFNDDSMIEVAQNRDLVRVEIQTKREGIELSDITPDIGERVEFYGNAGGGKVITVTVGKILAVGQERIEIDSPIQGGNSGSPLIKASDGKVIGVTTISTFNRLDNDPSKVGTRYDPRVKLTREFAVRFTGVKWVPQQYGAFLKAINVYKDLCTFYNWMNKVCLADRQVGVYEYQLPDLKFRGATQLNDYMKRIAKCDEEEKKAWDRYKMMREKNKSGGTLNKYGQMEFDNQVKRIKDCTKKAFTIRQEVLDKVCSYVKSTKYLSSEEREEASDAFDWQYRKYCDKYRMQLKGLNLFPESSNQ